MRPGGRGRRELRGGGGGPRTTVRAGDPAALGPGGSHLRKCEKCSQNEDPSDKFQSELSYLVVPGLVLLEEPVSAEGDVLYLRRDPPRGLRQPVGPGRRQVEGATGAVEHGGGHHRGELGKKP